MQDKIALRIMMYWGYEAEFNPDRYSFVRDNKAEYIAKKKRKFEMAQHHAQELAKIALEVIKAS